MSKEIRVLRVDASALKEGSTSRALSDSLIDGLRSRHANVAVSTRDLSEPLPHVDQSWVYANFTDPSERDDAQKSALTLSDSLVQELMDADVLVIGVPVYNFGVPAALKAWIDMVARARLTFRYTENGPKGLLEGKKAYLVVASGGTEIGGPIDFATPYMQHVLGFLGIDDVEVISASQQMARGEAAVKDAQRQVTKILNDVNAIAA